MQTLDTFPVITISDECYDTIQAAGVGSSQARFDIQTISTGEKSAEDFRAECLNGADEILAADWNEYVDAVVSAAISEVYTKLRFELSSRMGFEEAKVLFSQLE